jgi:molecular chaperone GrpE
MELVRDNFLAKLRDHGVVPMDVEGERFDPERHEAMSVVPVGDPALDNHVVGVIRGGYAMGDDVLRPAGVAVGRVG